MAKANKTPARPTQEEIAARAYEIYIREGRPVGREKEHWMAAEAALVKERTMAQPQKKGPSISKSDLTGKSTGSASGKATGSTGARKR
jgi:hypothetical protein